MIRLSEIKVLENYFIDENGVITDINGVVQKVYLHGGRPTFKKVTIHRILMYTFYGYKKMDIHHIDKNPLNNSLSNLVYLTREEHARLHHKGQNHPFYGQHHSEESKQKMSESHKGRHWNLSEETKQKMSLAKRNMSEETKQKMSESLKGKNNWTKDLHWFNDGIKNFYCKECPAGCIPGRIKCPQ